MKRILLILILLLSCQIAFADLILLKNGKIIEGKIVQVRDIFIRVLDNYDSPFKEFLIEDIINIEQSSPNEISKLSIRNIHQRALNRANSGKIQAAIDKRATELLEAAIQTSEVTTLETASDEVRTVAQEKASAIIGEAVISVEIPRLDEVHADVKSIAEEKAINVIEQAVKIVEVLPLQKAPIGVQFAAKQAATVLVSEAVMDMREEKSALNIKDFIIGGLAVALLFLLYQVKKKNQKDSKNRSDQVPTRKEKNSLKSSRRFYGIFISVKPIPIPGDNLFISGKLLRVSEARFKRILLPLIKKKLLLILACEIPMRRGKSTTSRSRE